MIVINLLNNTQLTISWDFLSIRGENWFIEINTWLGISYTFDWINYPPRELIKWRK